MSTIALLLSAVAIVTWTAYVTVGCATPTYLGVYIGPAGDQTLITCTLERAADGHPLLFCSNDEREAW